jgi:hypothetical protein
MARAKHDLGLACSSLLILLLLPVLQPVACTPGEAAQHPRTHTALGVTQQGLAGSQRGQQLPAVWHGGTHGGFSGR